MSDHNDESDLERRAREAGEAVRRAFDTASELAERAGRACTLVEDRAVRAVLRAEDVYDSLEVEKRLAGAGIGAKVGLAGALLASAKITVPLGLAAGALLGPKGIDRFKEKRNKWRADRAVNENTPGVPAPKKLNEPS